MSDTLRSAGHLSCPKCQAVSYAMDAAWLDTTCLVARFAASCIHVTETVCVISPATLSIDRRCQATTARGTRCTLTALNGGWCPVHAPSHRGWQ